MRGLGRSGTLSSLCIVHTLAFHFATWLDAEVREVARVFAMQADDFARSAALHHKGSERHLKTLFLTIADQIFFMLNGMNNRVGRK